MMTPQESKDFTFYLTKLYEAYEEYRSFQEQEHAHLSRRGAISEWSSLVRRKHQAYQNAQMVDAKVNPFRQKWMQLGTSRSRADYSIIREKLSQLQTLLTRVLSCDRMNETLLYNGGYLQAVVAYRSSVENGAVPVS
jgi:hypothetical protein